MCRRRLSVQLVLIKKTIVHLIRRNGWPVILNSAIYYYTNVYMHIKRRCLRKQTTADNLSFDSILTTPLPLMHGWGDGGKVLRKSRPPWASNQCHHIVIRSDKRVAQRRVDCSKHHQHIGDTRNPVFN